MCYCEDHCERQNGSKDIESEVPVSRSCYSLFTRNVRRLRMENKGQVPTNLDFMELRLFEAGMGRLLKNWQRGFRKFCSLERLGVADGVIYDRCCASTTEIIGTVAQVYPPSNKCNIIRIESNRIESFA
ncbi:hypothetical protein Tcan_01125, partial [Toxocara canis]